jgi:hypothetical protein
VALAYHHDVAASRGEVPAEGPRSASWAPFVIPGSGPPTVWGVVRSMVATPKGGRAGVALISSARGRLHNGALSEPSQSRSKCPISRENIRAPAARFLGSQLTASWVGGMRLRVTPRGGRGSPRQWSRLSEMPRASQSRAHPGTPDGAFGAPLRARKVPIYQQKPAELAALFLGSQVSVVGNGRLFRTPDARLGLQRANQAAQITATQPRGRKRNSMAHCALRSHCKATASLGRSDRNQPGRR